MAGSVAGGAMNMFGQLGSAYAGYEGTLASAQGRLDGVYEHENNVRRMQGTQNRWQGFQNKYDRNQLGYERANKLRMNTDNNNAAMNRLRVGSEQQTQRMKLGADLDVKSQKRMFNFKVGQARKEGISPGLLMLGQGNNGANSTRSTYLNGGYRTTSKYDNASYTGSLSQQQTNTGLI